MREYEIYVRNETTKGGKNRETDRSIFEDVMQYLSHTINSPLMSMESRLSN